MELAPLQNGRQPPAREARHRRHQGKVEVQVEHIRLTPRVETACVFNWLKVILPFKPLVFQLSTCTPLRRGEARAGAGRDQAEQGEVDRGGEARRGDCQSGRQAAHSMVGRVQA